MCGSPSPPPAVTWQCGARQPWPGRLRPAHLPWGQEAASHHRRRHGPQGPPPPLLTCQVGQSLFMFVSPFPVASVSTADRWARVDGFFNLLPIKRLYFDYLRLCCGVCDPGVIITGGIATSLQRGGEGTGHQGTCVPRSLGNMPLPCPFPGLVALELPELEPGDTQGPLRLAA